MSSSGSHAMSNSNSITSDLYRPLNSMDPGWKYGRLTNKNDPNAVKCLLCDTFCKGGITRFKFHLAGIKGNVRKCPKANAEVQKEITEYLEMIKKKAEDRKRSKEDLVADVNINIDVSESEELEIEGDTKRLRALKKPVNLVKDKGPWRQQVIKDTYGKEQRDKVNDFLAFWAYKRGISFNSLADPDFLRFCEAVGQYGPGYKPPTRYEYSVPLLKRQVSKTMTGLEVHKEAWGRNGCTLMTDAWTDRRSRSLMNLCVNSSKGTVFWKAIDASSESHTAEFILEFVESGVKEVGEENVLQVVTDNAAANMKAAELFMAKYQRIYWTSCAAHSIDLMLESISKQKEISDAIRDTKEIANFIYSHHQVLSLMRAHTENRDIVRPGATRFATSFLTLESIYQKKLQLKRMVLSDEYNALIDPSKKKRKKFADKGKKISKIVVSNNFWKSVALAIKIFKPLVVLLRIVDGEDKQPMGFVYGGLKDAIKEIKAAVRYNEGLFEPYVKAIVDGMKGRLDKELHKAAYYLNPYYFYRDYEEMKTDPSIMDAISNCVVRFYPTSKIQDLVMTVEMRSFQESMGQFGKDAAKRQRETNNEAFNPAHWWSIHGSEAPYLRNIAIKILGLTCSSSGCERNWSTFEWTHSKKRGKLEVQRLNDIVFVQFNARLNDLKILKKSDPMCAREEEQDEHVRDWTGGPALDLPEEISLASSSTSSSTPLARNTDKVGIDDIGDDDISDYDISDDDDDDDDDEALIMSVEEEE